MPYLLTLAWKNYQKLSAVASKNGIGYCHRHLFLAMRNLPKKIIILLQTLFLQTFYILTTKIRRFTTHYALNVSCGGFKIFNFTDHFQIDYVPGASW